MSPLEQWLSQHTPEFRAAAHYRAPFSRANGRSLHLRAPLTHTELWAALIADSDYLEPFNYRELRGPALTVAGTRSRLGVAHHVGG